MLVCFLFLYIWVIEGKGCGVFMVQEILVGSVIEFCLVLVLLVEDMECIYQIIFYDYYFFWGISGESVIVLGFGLFYNYVSVVNVDYVMDIVS